jgi:hypothetical protein
MAWRQATRPVLHLGEQQVVLLSNPVAPMMIVARLLPES